MQARFKDHEVDIQRQYITMVRSFSGHTISEATAIALMSEVQSTEVHEALLAVCATQAVSSYPHVSLLSKIVSNRLRGYTNKMRPDELVCVAGCLVWHTHSSFSTTLTQMEIDGNICRIDPNGLYEYYLSPAAATTIKPRLDQKAKMTGFVHVPEHGLLAKVVEEDGASRLVSVDMVENVVDADKYDPKQTKEG